MHGQSWSHIWSRSVHQFIRDVQTPGLSSEHTLGGVCESDTQEVRPNGPGRVMNGTHLDQCQVFQIKPEEVISVKRKDGCELWVAFPAAEPRFCSADYYLCVACSCFISTPLKKPPNL